jgi:PAS domain S-box-containing protein
LELTRRGEERFRTLADSIAQLAWMADAKGTVIWRNKRWQSYSGSAMEMVEGSSWEKLLHPDYIQPFAEKMNYSLRAGEYLEDTIPLRGQDGQYRWFLSAVVPILNKDGGVWRWFGTHTDITRQREAEENLRRKDESLSRAQEIAHLGSWELDLGNNRLSWSDEL